MSDLKPGTTMGRIAELERRVEALEARFEPNFDLTATGAEPLLDPDCRDQKHGSCVGAPCECPCHQAVSDAV